MEELLKYLEGKDLKDVDRKKLRALINGLMNATSFNAFKAGIRSIERQFGIGIPEEDFKEEFEKQRKQRNKVANYGKMATRQTNLFIKQAKAQGIEAATEKVERRVDLAMKNETNHFKDGAKIAGAAIAVRAIIKRETKKAKDKGERTAEIPYAVKTWIHGMYGEPKSPRYDHVEADGQTVPLNGKFYVSGEYVDRPRTFGDPSEDIWCHCGIEVKKLKRTVNL